MVGTAECHTQLTGVDVSGAARCILGYFASETPSRLLSTPMKRSRVPTRYSRRASPTTPTTSGPPRFCYWGRARATGCSTPVAAPASTPNSWSERGREWSPSTRARGWCGSPEKGWVAKLRSSERIWRIRELLEGRYFRYGRKRSGEWPRRGLAHSTLGVFQGLEARRAARLLRGASLVHVRRAHLQRRWQLLRDRLGGNGVEGIRGPSLDAEYRRPLGA